MYAVNASNVSEQGLCLSFWTSYLTTDSTLGIGNIHHSWSPWVTFTSDDETDAAMDIGVNQNNFIYNMFFLNIFCTLNGGGINNDKHVADFEQMPPISFEICAKGKHMTL